MPWRGMAKGKGALQLLGATSRHPSLHGSRPSGSWQPSPTATRRSHRRQAPPCSWRRPCWGPAGQKPRPPSCDAWGPAPQPVAPAASGRGGAAAAAALVLRVSSDGGGASPPVLWRVDMLARVRRVSRAPPALAGAAAASCRTDSLGEAMAAAAAAGTASSRLGLAPLGGAGELLPRPRAPPPPAAAPQQAPGSRPPRPACRPSPARTATGSTYSFSRRSRSCSEPTHDHTAACHAASPGQFAHHPQATTHVRA